MGITLSKNLDKISKLPLSIIENILCLVPIKEAVRTSILSKDWRYNWTKIPKLVFHQKDMLDKTSDEFFDAIHQVLLRHPGPIVEFRMSLVEAIGKHDKIDQIITHLARKNNDTVKKFTLEWHFQHKLSLSISLLHRLTDLSVSGTYFCDPTLSGFGSLTSLCIKGGIINKDSILHFLSNCPILNHVGLEPGYDTFNKDTMIFEQFTCLPVVESFTIHSDWLWFKRDRVPARLPTAFVKLKYLCIKEMVFHDSTLENLLLAMMSSPNLEDIKIEVRDKPYNGPNSVRLKRVLYIWFEHLKKLEIRGFAARNGAMEFAQLILVKSPMLMNARIIPSIIINKDEELEIARLLLGSPRVSLLAELIVEGQAISMRAKGRPYEYAITLDRQPI